MRWIAALMVAILSSVAGAATDCTSIQDDLVRLGCYDKNVGFKKPEKKPNEKSAPQRPEWATYFSVRDEGTYQKLGKNPASFLYNRVKGEDASAIKAAVVWIGPAWTDDGLQPFASYGLNRNTLASQRTDLRTAMVGLTTIFGDYFKDGIGYWPTLKVSDRKDKKELQAGNAAVLDTLIVIKKLNNGIPFEGGFVLNPRIGAMYEDVRENKTKPTGKYAGGFAALEGSYWPVAISTQLEIRGRLQRYADRSAGTGLSKRYLNYASLAFDFYLFPPAQKDYWLQPIFSVEREVGGDPVIGKYGINTTTVGLKLLVN